MAPPKPSQIMSYKQLSKHPPFILITENKGGPALVLKQRIYSAQWKYELPGLGKMQVGRGNIWSFI